MKLNIQLFADGSVTIAMDLDTRPLEKKIAEVEGELEQYSKDLEKALDDPHADPKMIKEIKKNIKEASKELEQLQSQLVKTGSGSNGMGGILKSMTKWGLAIFSIRSAYMLIRRSASELSQQNDEIAGKINAISGSITNLLAPVVEVIVNLVYRLLAYLNVITKEFLGLDLFEKSKNSSKATLGNAKKLRKTIAGFDEMNVLNDNTATSGGGGGGKLSTPEPPDTSQFEETVKEYKKMWNEILETDRKEAKKLITQSDKTWGLLKLGVWDLTQGLVYMFQGVIDTFKGLWDIIVGLSQGNTDKIWEGAKKLFEGITEQLRGALQVILSAFEMIFGVIVGFFKGTMASGRQFGEFIQEKIVSAITPIIDAFGKLGTKISSVFAGAKETATSVWGAIKNYIIDKVITPITNKIDTIKNTIKNNFSGGFWKGIANTFIGIINSAISKINSKFSFSISDKTAKVLKAIGIKASAGKYQILSIPKLSPLAKGGIINMPGRGVPLASGGEAGREGVIPLTDSQQMALLGEAIGRYITINASITNTMNGRVISRELKRIQNENSFAGNR